MKLGPKAIELINCNELTAELMARGWNVYLPVYDDGIDILAMESESDKLLRIQLKSRWTIDKKYQCRNIEKAFSEKGICYLILHDDAVALGNKYPYCSSKSWTRDNGAYSVSPMSRHLSIDMQPHTLDARLGSRRINP